VFATVAPGTRSRGVTAFVIEKGAEGFSVGPPMAKLGQRAIHRDLRLVLEQSAEGFPSLIQGALLSGWWEPRQIPNESLHPGTAARRTTLREEQLSG